METPVSKHLVTYREPPITEVVIAVAFKALDFLSPAHMGALWSRSLADEFPRVEERPPYDPPIEQFQDAPTPSSLTISPGLPPMRLWLINRSGEELIQLQRNWLAYNWRRQHKTSAYMRWNERLAAFERAYDVLANFADDFGATLEPIQCEVTYINHVEMADLEGHAGLPHVLRAVSSVDVDPRIALEQAQVRLQYVIDGSSGDPIGRIHVQYDPVVNRSTGKPAFAINLTARGSSVGGGPDGVRSFMNTAHQSIVRVFEALTSDEIKRRWGRQT